jgi:hypothetical protein
VQDMTDRKLLGMEEEKHTFTSPVLRSNAVLWAGQITQPLVTCP